MELLKNFLHLEAVSQSSVTWKEPETRIWMQVVYLGGEPRTQVWRKAEWDRRKENMDKGCLTEVLSARGNRSSGPWGLSKAPCRMCHWMVSPQEGKLRQLSTTSFYLLVEGWPLGVNSLAFYGCICVGPRGLWKEPWAQKSESPIANTCVETLVISMLLSLHWYKGTGDVDQGRKHICFRQNSSHKCHLMLNLGWTIRKYIGWHRNKSLFFPTHATLLCCGGGTKASPQKIVLKKKDKQILRFRGSSDERDYPFPGNAMPSHLHSSPLVNELLLLTKFAVRFLALHHEQIAKDLQILKKSSNIREIKTEETQKNR